MSDATHKFATAACLGTFVLVAALALHPIGDTDFWWHLRTGQWIWQNHTLPRVDVFSYTAAGTKWINHEWLFQAALWPVFVMAGINGVIIAKTAILLATFGLLYAAFAREGRSSWLPAAVTLGALVGCTRFTVRPDLFAYLFAAAMIFVGERRLSLWLLPALELLWVNSQASFPLGVFLAGAYALAQGKRGIVPALVSAGITLVNPFGFELIRSLFVHFALTGHIDEWQPTLAAVRGASGLRVWLYLVLLAGALVAAGRAAYRRDWTRAVILVGLALLSLRAVRFVMLFAVLAAPFIAAELFERWRAPATVAAAILVVQLATLAGIVSNRFYVFERVPQRFGFGVDETRVPLRAARFLREVPATGPLFNTYGAGGPILWECWPKWRVFIDGRLVLYDPELVRLEREARGSPDVWRTLEARYDFRVAFLETQRAGILPELLLRDNRWRLAYSDESSAIFVRP